MQRDQRRPEAFLESGQKQSFGEAMEGGGAGWLGSKSLVQPLAATI
jgi:hypothetical protein